MNGIYWHGHASKDPTAPVNAFSTLTVGQEQELLEHRLAMFQRCVTPEAVTFVTDEEVSHMIENEPELAKRARLEINLITNRSVY